MCLNPLKLAAAVAIIIFASTPQTEAQSWPTKPIRVIIPFGGGSAVDIIARLTFEQLSQQLGKPVVIENRTGAGGSLAAGFVAKAEPDGHTILVHTSALTISPALYPNLGYDPAADFSAVVPLGVSPNVLVVPSSKSIETTHQLVRLAKEKPGTLNFASVGIGTATHLSAERFGLSAGIKSVHVPFKNASEALSETLAGRVDYFFGPVPLVLPHIQNGKLRALAVNSRTRASTLPDIPTTIEAGFEDSDYPIWFGMFVPTRTPGDVIEKLHHETLNALRTSKVSERLSKLGVEPMPMTLAEFKDHIAAEFNVNARLARTLGLGHAER